MSISVAVLSAGALGLGMGAQSVKPDAGARAAVRLLHDQVASARTPAVQYRHFDRDSLLLAYDDGLADIRRGMRVSERTTFNGFSVTKTVTAVAILQLVDRGVVDLDAPASTYLPDFPYPAAITVRQLLTHSAGLPNPIPLKWIHTTEEHSDFQPRAFFSRVFADNRKVGSPPNSRMKYSNLGYVLLGQLIENVSGLSYERYVTDNILSPMGLSAEELGFVLDPQRHAIGYHRRRSISRFLLHFMIDGGKYFEPGRTFWQAFRPYHVNGPAYGGLVGTADGFMRYVQALLDPSNGLLSEESRRALFTENVLQDGTPSRMALSWFRGELSGYTYHVHAGGGGGFYAEIRVYPELQRGSVILFNRTGFSDARFLDRIDRHILEGAPDSAGAVWLRVDTSQARAVRDILGRRAAGEAVPEAVWTALFASEGYRRMMRRERDLDERLGIDRGFLLEDS